MKQRYKKYQKICNSLGVYLKITKSKKHKSSFWRNKTNRIFIKPTKDINFLDSSFCHEIAHVLCYYYGIYPVFHGRKGTTKDRIKAKIKYGILVEQYVDKFGSVLKNELKLKSGKYYFGYSTKQGKIYYKNRINTLKGKSKS